MSNVDKLKTGLMGVGKAEALKTDRQRALRRLILCRRVDRRFPDNRPELWAAQERLGALCSRFVSARGHDEVIKLATEIVDLDERLSRLQSTEDLETAEDTREVGDRVTLRDVCSCKWNECAADKALGDCEPPVDELTAVRLRKQANCRKALA